MTCITIEIDFMRISWKNLFIRSVKFTEFLKISLCHWINQIKIPQVEKVNCNFTFLICIFYIELSHKNIEFA